MKCAIFRSDCKWTAKLNGETNLITPLHEHDHDVEDYKSDIFNLKTKCKQSLWKVKQILDKFFMIPLELIHALVKLPLLSVNQQCIVLDERRSLKFTYQHLNSVKWYLSTTSGKFYQCSVSCSGETGAIFFSENMMSLLAQIWSEICSNNFQTLLGWEMHYFKFVCRGFRISICVSATCVINGSSGTNLRMVITP